MKKQFVQNWSQDKNKVEFLMFIFKAANGCCITCVTH